MTTTPATMDEIGRRLARVEILLLDVDGVLTDGGVTLGDTGQETKTFHIRDGLGLRLWQRAGFRAGFVTGRSSRAVEQRAAELGIAFLRQGVTDKVAAVAGILESCALSWDQTAFVGDDLPDLPVVRRCGLGVAVADACAELQAAAALVTSRPGGRGAVREVVERLLVARGAWQSAVADVTGGIA